MNAPTRDQYDELFAKLTACQAKLSLMTNERDIAVNERNREFDRAEKAIAEFGGAQPNRIRHCAKVHGGLSKTRIGVCYGRDSQGIQTGENMSTPIRHIGYLSLCDAKRHKDSIVRIDLGVKRYRQLGVKDRFKGEKPYRVCKRCIAKLEGE